MMGTPGSRGVSETEGKNIFTAKFSYGYCEVLQDKGFSLFWTTPRKNFPKVRGAAWTEKRIDMLVNHRIGNTCVDSIVVEEEDAITTPVLNHALHQTERKTFVAERINEGESGHQSDSLQGPPNSSPHVSRLDDRLVLQRLDTGQLGDLLCKVLSVTWVLIVEKCNQTFPKL